MIFGVEYPILQTKKTRGASHHGLSRCLQAAQEDHIFSLRRPAISSLRANKGHEQECLTGCL
jgi:hypothetical protein